jgi:nicotinamidase-related amidase
MPGFGTNRRLYKRSGMSAEIRSKADLFGHRAGMSVAIVGIATEIGIEPTARHAADLCFIPVIIADACGAGDEAAVHRSLEALDFAGDAIISDTETFTDFLRRA